MSRAFVKEHDEPDLRLERPAGRAITPSGYAELHAIALAEQESETRAALLASLSDTVVVAPPEDRRTIAFGARVRVLDGDEGERVFTIVGEDEIDIARGRIGEASPLAKALLGKRAGSSAIWERPKGKRKLKIVDVSYHDASSHAA